MQPLGPWLRSIRERGDLTAAHVASVLGVPTSTFSKYELGRRHVPYELLDAWGAALGVRIEIIARSAEDPGLPEAMTEAQQGLLDQVMTSIGALDDVDCDLVRGTVERLAARRGGPI